MDRPSTAQTYIDSFDDPVYLEIGVNRGETFHRIRANTKVAVDPTFLFPMQARQQNAHYFEMESDAYFAKHDKSSMKFTTIFIDGLHTFEQTLRDFMNSIAALADGGVIILDDVFPNSYLASISDKNEFEQIYSLISPNGDRSWMGDVFKVVFFIHSFMPLFEFACTSDNHGQCIVWRSDFPKRTFTYSSLASIYNLEYKDVHLQRDIFNFRGSEEIFEMYMANRIVK